MNEWRQLLQQTHPGFQSTLVTVDEALAQAEATNELVVSDQLSLANESSAQEATVDTITEENSESKELANTEESVSEQQSEVFVAHDEETTGAITEIEWISPTHKLQQKIVNIPDKMAFKIGEAADYVGVKQYVLRYWESEFDMLQPKKSKNGQRMYSKKDVETALLIKKLLHEDRFSIEGAQAALRKLRKQVKEHTKEQAGVVTPQELTVSVADPAVDYRGSLVFAQALLNQIQHARAHLGLDQ